MYSDSVQGDNIGVPLLGFATYAKNKSIWSYDLYRKNSIPGYGGFVIEQWYFEDTAIADSIYHEMSYLIGSSDCDWHYYMWYIVQVDNYIFFFYTFACVYEYSLRPDWKLFFQELKNKYPKKKLRALSHKGQILVCENGIAKSVIDTTLLKKSKLCTYNHIKYLH